MNLESAKILSILIISVSAPISASDVAGINLLPNVSINGQRYISPRNASKSGYAYYGIRYGTANRFEHSVENTNFDYLNNPSRLKQGFICPQRGYISFGTTIADLRPFNRTAAMNEDCLYLDIYVPTVNTRKALPVLLYFYGGSLQIGDKDIYNGSVLTMETDTVVVVINYRLAVFGFLGIGDESLPGNYGLGDCKTAINWVVKHISKFGGDPSRITIFGQSSGALITSAVYLDPDYRRKITAAVALSGSILADQVWTRNPNEKVTQLANETSCPVEPIEQMIACLKNVPMTNLLAASKGLDNQFVDAIPYGFVVDSNHFKEKPALQIEHEQNSGDALFLTGYMREESSIILSNNNPEFFNASIPLTWNVLRDALAAAYLPSREQCPVPKFYVADQVMTHYNVNQNDTREAMLLKYFHLTSDANFAYPALKESSLYLHKKGNNGSRNQFYIVSYDSKYADLGAFHAMELGYIFGDDVNRKIFNITLNPVVERSYHQMLRQVAYNGKMDGPLLNNYWRYSELGEDGLWREGHGDLHALFSYWDSIVKMPCNAALKRSNDS